MGYDKAIVTTKDSGTSITFSIRYPEEKGLLPFLRKTLMFPFDMWSSAKSLQMTMDTLVKRNRELEEETSKLSKAEAFLRVQKEQLDLLDKSQSMVFFTLDLDLNPIYYSVSCEKLLGYTAEEALQLPALAMVHETSRDVVTKTLGSYLAQEAAEPFFGSVTTRLLRIRKDQTTFWTENYVSFLRDSDGVAIGLIGVMVDISDRVNIEQRQEALEFELKEAHQRELVGRVAGGIAHDFNNSLQTIIGFSEIIESNAKAGLVNKDDVIRNNQQVLKAATSASELVRQLLALGRRQTLSLQVFDIGNWIEECRPILSTILDANINFSVDIPAGLTIEGDKAQLERVLANLALNAKDAMPGGGGFRILARQKQDLVELVFEDTGTGIPDSIIEQVFEPFFTSQEVHEGSGLGLAVTAGIVEQHHGAIKAESQEGAGTRIIVTLPYKAGLPEQKSTLASDIPQLDAPSRILVVDDREVIRELIKAMLEDQPIEIIEAKDGNDAVTKFSEHHRELDMVLMDIVMPGQNGDLAAIDMRAMDDSVPIVFMTGYAGDYTDLAAFHDETVIKKPFSRRELFTELNRYLSRPVASSLIA